MKWKKLIILGDSNTQFGNGESAWISKISDLLQRKCDVINRGFSGYNTDQIKTILPKILKEFEPHYVCGCVIMLGTNDSATNDLQHVPLERYRENMKSLLEILFKFGIEKRNCILLSPPIINDAKWKEEVFNKFGSESSHFDHLVREYALASIQVAKELDVE